MPGGDRTGPLGLGPRTGRGLGYCSGYNRPGFMSRAFGRFGWAEEEEVEDSAEVEEEAGGSGKDSKH